MLDIYKNTIFLPPYVLLIISGLIWPCSAHKEKIKPLERRDLMSQMSHVFSNNESYNDAIPKSRPSSASRDRQMSCDHDEHMQKWHTKKSQSCFVRFKHEMKSGKCPLYITLPYTKGQVTGIFKGAVRSTWQGSLLKSSNLLMLKDFGSNKTFPACQSEASRKVVWQIYLLGSLICSSMSWNTILVM